MFAWPGLQYSQLSCCIHFPSHFLLQL
jgi:hypothetical protein